MMDIIALIQYGTPIILLGLIISNVRLADGVRDLKDGMKDMKGEHGVVWHDTCKASRDGIEHRLERLEGQVNGK